MGEWFIWWSMAWWESGLSIDLQNQLHQFDSDSRLKFNKGINPNNTGLKYVHWHAGFFCRVKQVVKLAVCKIASTDSNSVPDSILSRRLVGEIVCPIHRRSSVRGWPRQQKEKWVSGYKPSVLKTDKGNLRGFESLFLRKAFGVKYPSTFGL